MGFNPGFQPAGFSVLQQASLWSFSTAWKPSPLLVAQFHHRLHVQFLLQRRQREVRTAEETKGLHH